MSAPERMPGMNLMDDDLEERLHGVQPRSSAASSRFGSSGPSFGITDRMTYGKLNVMCAMRSVVKPRTLLSFIICPANAKSSASETPVTISGFVSGIFVTAIVMRRIRPDMARMPMAAMVPSTVATSEAITATMTEFASSGSSTPVAEERAVLREREALPYGDIRTGVKRRNGQHDHRDIQKQEHDHGENTVEGLHIVATSSSSEKRFMTAMHTSTITISTSESAAPRFGL